MSCLVTALLDHSQRRMAFCYIMTSLSVGNRNRIDPSQLNLFSFFFHSSIYLLLTGVIRKKKEEGNVLFNDALNTFYLRLYGVGYMVEYHLDSERKPAAATWATLSD